MTVLTDPPQNQLPDLALVTPEQVDALDASALKKARFFDLSSPPGSFFYVSRSFIRKQAEKGLLYIARD